MLSRKELDAMRGFVEKNIKKAPDPLSVKPPKPGIPRGNKNQLPPKGWKK